MTRPMIRIHDCSTNETIDREMNDEEYAQHLKDVEESERIRLASEAEQAAQAEAKAAALAKLAALGLTEEEAKAIAG